MKYGYDGLPLKIKEELSSFKQHYEDLQKIFEYSFDQITIADGNGVLLMSSKNSSNYFGIDSENIVGLNVQELEDKGILKPSVTLMVLRSRKKETIVQDTGTGKRLMVTGLPMFNDKGELIRVLNISQDITEIEKLNRKLEDTEEILDWFRNELLRTMIPERGFIKSNSPAMTKVFDIVKHVSSVDATVLLLGETGVGKGFIADTIHHMSDRRNNPFIKVNCSAIPHNLLESELFGYVKGAFTGANDKGKRGYFEIADKGTLLLDEIAEISVDMQVKLLHVIENNELFRIGDNAPTKINTRIIAATNKDLMRQVREGAFRQDLYYRLNVVPIHIPPLRERYEDVPLFIKYFLNKSNTKYGLVKELSSSAYEILCTYAWPGNVRELENAIERLVITSSQAVIDSDCVQDVINHNKLKFTVQLPEIVPLKQAVLEMERQLLKKAFNEFKTTRKMAEALEVDQSTVVKKIKTLKQSNLWDP